MDAVDISLDESVDANMTIGKGCYGTVYEVKVKGETYAAKRVHDILTGARGQSPVSEEEKKPLLKLFQREISIMNKIGEHRNVVKFLGVCKPSGDPGDHLLVMEKLYMNLNQLITIYPCITASLPIKLNILRDISSGLEHIHSNKIIHRDLNAGNVLLTHTLLAKVADFGASRVVDRYTGHLTKHTGAPDYMPPEALHTDPEVKYTKNLDVFSFAHLSLYLINGIYPKPVTAEEALTSLTPVVPREKIYTCMQQEQRKKWLDRLKFNPCLYQLIFDCFQGESESRPTNSHVLQTLEVLCSKNKSMPNVHFIKIERQVRSPL